MRPRSKIVLATANARYSHCAFGLRRLAAVLCAHGYTPVVLEFTIQQSPFEIAESLLEGEPDVIGLGVYIWNVEITRHVVHIVHAVSPQTVLVLGGPEIQGDATEQDMFAGANYFVQGEGEDVFRDLVECLDSGKEPGEWILPAMPTGLDELASPYDLYSTEDIENRIVYVESSRGCPYRCSFCLSATDSKVRYFPLDGFLDSMEMLLAKGVQLFKFTDRTFNIRHERMVRILDFFLERLKPGLQLHFELMPDHLDEVVWKQIARFPAGVLHLEVGVQSFSAEVQRRIGRHQDIGKSMDTIRRLRNETGALLHADLIVGLPGDRVEDLAAGFDALVEAKVQEIQVGLLKRLKGTPLATDPDNTLVFDEFPPYEILCTPVFDFAQIQALKRFARYFDMYYNSGNFPQSLQLCWENHPSPFWAFSGLAKRIWAAERRTHGIPLARLAEYLFEYLCSLDMHRREDIAFRIEEDFRRLPGRLDKLGFLK